MQEGSNTHQLTTSVTPPTSFYPFKKKTYLWISNTWGGRGGKVRKVFPHTNLTFHPDPCGIIRAADQVHQEKQ